MKKNNNLIKISVLLILITVFILFSYTISKAESITINPEQFNPGTNIGSEKLSNIGGVVLGIINAIGAFVAVGMLMVMGIKFMLGSIEEKAEYKSLMFPYVLGAILLFSGTTLLNLIYRLVTN